MTATSRSLAPAALLIFFSLLVGGVPSAELAAASTDAEESLRCAVDRVSIVQDSDFPAPEGEKLIGVEVQFLKWRKYHSPDEIVAFNDTTANDAGRAMFLYAQRLARRSHARQDGGTQESAAEESPRFLLIFSVPVSWRAVKLGYQHSCGDLTALASPISDSRHAAANGEATADHSQVKPDCADAYCERGQAWCLKGELDKAIADYSRALRLDPNHIKGYNRRASAWSERGEYDKAIADCNQALRLRPDDAEGYHNRGKVRSDKGEYDKAIADFVEAVRLKPNYAEAYKDLAWLQATCPDDRYRRGKEAVTNAKRACQTRGTNPTEWRHFIQTLAAAYAEDGQFDEAVESQKKAIQMAATSGDAAETAKAELRSMLELYNQGKPYRYREPAKKP